VFSEYRLPGITAFQAEDKGNRVMVSEAWKSGIRKGYFQLPPQLPRGRFTVTIAEENFTGALGSGPRGRRFKSSRPDQF